MQSIETECLARRETMRESRPKFQNPFGVAWWPVSGRWLTASAKEIPMMLGRIPRNQRNWPPCVLATMRKTHEFLPTNSFKEPKIKAGWLTCRDWKGRVVTPYAAFVPGCANRQTPQPAEPRISSNLKELPKQIDEGILVSVKALHEMGNEVCKNGDNAEALNDWAQALETYKHFCGTQKKRAC